MTLADPNAGKTSVSGLTVPGDYAFTVTTSDGRATATREVRITVFAGNQPPVPIDVHNRLPVMLTLPATSTSLRGGAWDLEGDRLAYSWRVLSAPGLP